MDYLLSTYQGALTMQLLQKLYDFSTKNQLFSVFLVLGCTPQMFLDILESWVFEYWKYYKPAKSCVCKLSHINHCNI